MTGLDALKIYYRQRPNAVAAAVLFLIDRVVADTDLSREQAVEIAANGTVAAFNRTTEHFEKLLQSAIDPGHHDLIEEMCLHAYVDYIPPNSLGLNPMDAPPTEPEPGLDPAQDRGE